MVGAMRTSPAPSSVRAAAVLRVRRVDPPAVVATRDEMRGEVGIAIEAAAVPLSGTSPGAADDELDERFLTALGCSPHVLQ